MFNLVASITPPTPSGMDNVLAGGETLLNVAVLCWNFCVANPYLAIIICGGLFALAFKLFSRGKRAVG